MQWAQKCVQLINLPRTPSRNYDFFLMDMRVGLLSQFSFVEKALCRLCKEADLVSSRKGPFSTHGSDCIKIGLRAVWV